MAIMRVGEYRTIVADPPWQYERPWPNLANPAKGFAGGTRLPLPYPSMTVAAIAALPVGNVAARDAHLYLWTTNKYLPEAFGVVRDWGFTYTHTLVWTKAPGGKLYGGTYVPTTEFVLFAKRGSAPARSRMASTWFAWKRTRHSVKPEAFQDMVEQVSPGPYLELFARRPRLGWDVWGNEVESSIVMAAD